MCAVPSVPGAAGVQGGKPMTSFQASLVVACIVAVSFVGCASPPPGSRDAGASGPSAGPGATVPERASVAHPQIS